jgi:hypothetical protein
MLTKDNCVFIISKDIPYNSFYENVNVWLNSRTGKLHIGTNWMLDFSVPAELCIDENYNRFVVQISFNHELILTLQDDEIYYNNVIDGEENTDEPALLFNKLELALIKHQARANENAKGEGDED